MTPQVIYGKIKERHILPVFHGSVRSVCLREGK